MMSVASQKRRGFNANFGGGNRKKSAGAIRRVWGSSFVVTVFIVKEKPTAGFPFFGTFLSDRFPKAMKDVNVHFSVYSKNSCKLYQRISGTFRS
jgi:hypothetical protein